MLTRGAKSFTEDLTGFDHLVAEAIRSDEAVSALTPGAETFSASEIRILCPHGHFIVNAAVIVIDKWPGILLRARGSGKRYFGPNVFEDQTHGFRFDSRMIGNNAVLRVRMDCKRTKCSYKGSFNYEALAIDLAEAVVARHAEYRLTA